MRKNLIAQGEGYHVEFKKGFSKDLGEEICAFANASGGKVFVGVDDTGSVVGVDSKK